MSTPGADTPKSIGSSDDYSEAEPVIDEATEENMEKVMDSLSFDRYNRQQAGGAHDGLSHIFR
ncbi:hypothetical protein ABTO49_21570, partial [Acinetobacter baumannii]